MEQFLTKNRFKGYHSRRSRGVQPNDYNPDNPHKTWSEFREAKKGQLNVKIIRNATPRGSCLFRGIGESRDQYVNLTLLRVRVKLGANSTPNIRNSIFLYTKRLQAMIIRFQNMFKEYFGMEKDSFWRKKCRNSIFSS